MLNYLSKFAFATAATAVLSLLPVACAPANAAANATLASAKTPAQSIVVVATAKVLPGKDAAFIAAVGGILLPTRAEARNLRFEFQRSVDDPTEFVFVETWATAAAIDAHMEAPHMLRFFKAVGPLFAPGYPTIKRYLPLEPTAG
jgi:quinol monooxygenase YgiN